MNKTAKRFYSIWILFVLTIPTVSPFIGAGYSAVNVGPARSWRMENFTSATSKEMVCLDLSAK